MTNVQICRLQEQDLPEVAHFLEQTRRSMPGATEVVLAHHTKEEIERRLHWRLVENPARSLDLELGQSLRSDSGQLVGVITHIPIYFRLGEHRLLGLCGGTFFVAADSGASFQSFLMFRRLVNAVGADFSFATTCNPTSAALWQTCEGLAVSGSEFECLLPLRYGPLAEELVFRRIPNAAIARLAKVIGSCSTPWLAPRRHRALKKVEPCSDWDLLADIAKRNRDSEVLTPERSSSYLQWRFDQGPQRANTQTFRYENESGEAGWFALQSSQRGRHGQIRVQTVIDLVRPLSGFSVEAFYSTLADLCRPEADMIALQGRATAWQISGGPRLLVRPYECAKAYVANARQYHPSLAQCIDLVPAIGDGYD